MTIELRTVSADDWRAWRSVRLAALTDAPGAFGSRLQEWADAPVDRWRDRLSIPGAIDLLAVDVDGNAPVGMVTGTPATDRPGRAELISMWVDPAVRSRGVATALITAIVRWAASTGATTLALSVMPVNDAARRTYERNGFTVSDEPGDLLPGGLRELVMLRDLSSERVVSDLRALSPAVRAPAVETLAWGSFTSFSDPDGNTWTVQQLPPPGSYDAPQA